MAEKIEALTMPKWGIEMEEGKITEWVIDEGKSFKRGEVLLVIETDKISFPGLRRRSGQSAYIHRRVGEIQEGT